MTLVELTCSKTKALQCGAQLAPSFFNLQLRLMEIFSLVLKTLGTSSAQLVVSARHVVYLYTQSRLYLGLVLTSDTAYMILLPQFDYSLLLFPRGREGGGNQRNWTMQENQQLLLSCHMQGFTGAFFLLSMCSVAVSQKW